jgi:hypothetical protein
MSKLRIEKHAEGSSCGLMLKYYPRIFPQGPRKTTENLGHDSRSPGREWNPGPPEYEAGMLATRPRRSVVPSNARLVH